MGLNRFFVLLFGCFLFAGCSLHKQNQFPEIPKVQFFMASGEKFPLASCIEELRQADFILVGENHANAYDHLVQAYIIDLARQERPNVVVGLEMVTSLQQPILDRFFQGEIGIDNLKTDLAWKESWGFPFSLYRPIFEAGSGLRFVALNLERQRIRELATGQEKIFFPFVAACSEQEKELRQIFMRHRAMMGKNMDESRFLKTQAFWDSVMAWNAWNARNSFEQKENGKKLDGSAQSVVVVILAGSGHIENGWGIEMRLRKLYRSARIVRFTPLRKMSELADFRQKNINGQTTTVFFLSELTNRD